MVPIRFTIFRLVIQQFGRLRGVRPLTQAFDAGLGVSHSADGTFRSQGNQPNQT